MRNYERRGAILIFALFFLLIALLWAALLADFGGALMTKQQAITAAENAALDAVTEFYPPPYQPIGTITNPNQWPGLLRQNPTRTRARLRAAEHEAGYTIDLLDRAGATVAPTSTNLIAHFGAKAPYVPNVQLNLANRPDGDVLLGLWGKVPGGPYRFVPAQGSGQPSGFANLPLAIQVMVRRTDEPRIDGVREGGNPIPFLFRRGAWTGQTGVHPGVYRNRGERLETVNTIALVPAATIGQAAVLPFQGGTGRIGIMPLVLVMRPPMRNRITGNNPNQTFQVQVDNTDDIPAAAEAYYTHYGITPPSEHQVIQRMLNFYRGVNPSIPPPQVTLNQLIPRPVFPFAQRRQLSIELLNYFRFQTWLVPVVTESDAFATNSRVVGFLHVYCEDVILGAQVQIRDRIVLRLAPSASSRNGIPLRGSVPAVIANEFFGTFWTTQDGQRVGPRPYGIACAGTTVHYGHVKR